MRTLVVGDVHGCADELEALVRHARGERVILVGDLFTKGPNPAGVWRQICDGGFESVLGNHDARLLSVMDGSDHDDHRAVDCVNVLEREAHGWVEWVRALPLFHTAGRFTVVHAGVHPSGDLSKTTREMALAMRRWPFRDPAAPHWHEVYAGDSPIIFGHDAVGGSVFVEREGRPFLVGLDTGCVYGGSLTGFVVETGERITVPATHAYCPTH